MNFTVLRRKEQLALAQQQTFDLIVIGGGITGAGIALDAAARGISVLLLEMQDFAEGTSSRSTKLVHGGLRYLKRLQVKEVAELGRERAIVYENGPHVTTPVWMLLPFHEGGTFGKFTTAVGLKVYDLLAGVKKAERRFMLTREETIEREPLVKRDGLVGGGVYMEYRTDDARLTIEVMKAAVEKGARAFNYMKAMGFNYRNLAFTEVFAEDQVSGEQYSFKSKKVVNATGPWVDKVCALDGDVGGKQMILSKGVHLVFDESAFPLQHAIYFDTESDGRMVFAIPRDGKTYVGTTDTFYEGEPEDMYVTQEDKDYLLAAIRYMFPQIEIHESDIESSWAGVRPLIHEEGKAPSEVSRKDEIWQSESGIITIAGGKLTGYRKMAEVIVNLVVKQLGVEYGRMYRACVTKRIPISGGELNGSRHFEQFVKRKTAMGQVFGLSVEEAERLARFYGTNVEKVFTLAEKSARLPVYLLAQLKYSILFESVMTPVDFFFRRTGYLLFNMSIVECYKDAVVEEMARQLRWSAEQKAVYLSELNEAIRNAKTDS